MESCSALASPIMMFQGYLMPWKGKYLSALPVVMAPAAKFPRQLCRKNGTVNKVRNL